MVLLVPWIIGCSYRFVGTSEIAFKKSSRLLISAVPSENYVSIDF